MGNNIICNSYEELKQKIDAHKILGDIIVFTSGTWDLVHIGHGNYLEAAIEFGKKFGDKVILVVGVDNDAEVKERKGKYRPIVPQDERLKMLAHLRHPNYVILKRELTHGWELVELLQPDVLVISESTNYEDKEGMIKGLKEWVKEVVILPPQAETSTTGKIRTLLMETVSDVKSRFAVVVNEFNSFLDELTGGVDRK